MGDITYWQQMSSIALNLENKRAAPPILTEVQEKNGKASDDMQYDFYADGDGQQTAEENQFMRNASQIAQLKRQQDMFDNYYTAPAPETHNRPRTRDSTACWAKDHQRAFANWTRRFEVAQSIPGRGVWHHGRPSIHGHGG